MTTLSQSKVWRPFYQQKQAPYGYNESSVRLSIKRTTENPNIAHASLLVHVGTRRTHIQIDIHPLDFEALAELLLRTNREAALKSFAKAILTTSAT